MIFSIVLCSCGFKLFLNSGKKELVSDLEVLLGNEDEVGIGVGVGTDVEVGVGGFTTVSPARVSCAITAVSLCVC